jgi:uncharacterized protein YdeI (YjbR/CyaY-like superfamily)
MEEKEIHTFSTSREFERWLSKHHARPQGVWLRFLKKDHRAATGERSVTYAEALDVALCYGWIDSKANKLDEASYIQKFSPRGKKSIWSKRNREHVARLIKEKKMRPAGLAQVAAAQKDGRWDAAYDSPKDMKVPADVIRAVSKFPKAKKFYDSLNRANTYAIAFRLATAKKPETRRKRFDAILAMLKRGEKFH